MTVLPTSQFIQGLFAQPSMDSLEAPGCPTMDFGIFQEAGAVDGAMAGQTVQVSQPLDMEVSCLTDESRQYNQKVEVMRPKRKPNTESPRFETPSKSRPPQHTAGTPETAASSQDGYGAIESPLVTVDRASSRPQVAVRVDDYNSESFQTTVDFIETQTQLTRVEVFRLREINNQRTRSLGEMAFFFAALRGLPDLQELLLYNFEEADLDLISSMVNQHPTLQRLHVQFIRGTVDPSFLDIVAEAPTLQEVSLDVQATFPLNLLLCSKTLTHVSVPTTAFQFSEEHVVAAMQELERNESLTCLDLTPPLSELGLRSLSFGLEVNHKLQIVKFSFVADRKAASQALLDFSHSLVQNSTLKVLENYSAKEVQVDQASILRMQELVHSNDTLERFSFFDDSEQTSIHIDLDDEEECSPGLACSSGWIFGMEIPFSWRPTETLSYLQSKMTSSPLVSNVQESLVQGCTRLTKRQSDSEQKAAPR